MNWLEIKIYTTTEGIEHVGGILLMIGVDGYITEDKNDFEQFLKKTESYWDYADKSLDRLKTVESSVTFYLTDDSQGRETFLIVKSELNRIKALDTEKKLGRLEVETLGVKQSDWENGWKKYFRQFNVGEKILILPPWEKAPESCTRKILTIDPGMSFGTGQHHTTKLCICSLEKYIKKGCKVLDLGSGSGILSIAALLLSAESATAVDIDEAAIIALRENADLNGFYGDKFKVFCGDILSDESVRSKISGKYDVVVANIVADVLIAFTPVFREFMHDNSILICSGIIEHRLYDVKSALVSHGYKIIGEKKMSEWYLIEIKL